MRIVYLESSLDDIEWMRFYYSHIFPTGKKQASIYIKTTERIIINKTPFSFIYRINEDMIEILRIWDQRGSRSKLGL